MTTEKELRKVYQQGQSAFYDGKKEEDNPYYHVPGKLGMWNNGFRDASDDIEDVEPHILEANMLGLIQE